MAVELEDIAALLEAQQAELAALREEVLRLRLGQTLEVLGTREVCRVLRIGRTKLHELIERGELRMWKLDGQRRITRAQLEAYIRELAERR